MVFADDVRDYDEKNREQQRLTEKKNDENRYGKNIKGEYKVASWVIMITIVIGIFLIPGQLFLQGVMKQVEDPMITDLQNNLSVSCQTGWCNRLLSFPMVLFNSFFSGALMVVWYLCADSLLAFKGAVMQAVGIFIVSFLSIIYKDGRPFWNSAEIVSYEHCVFSFASPSINSFNCFFFCAYKFIMSRRKYAGQTSTVTDGILIVLMIVANASVYVAGLVNGLTYLYQSAMGTLTAFVYLVIVLTFDKEIHRWCEKTGFILQSSRVRKFNTFFACLGGLVLYLMFYLAISDQWDVPQIWIINASFNSPVCTAQFNQRANNRIGTNQTFDQTGILFFIIGMVFGQSYSLNYVRPLLWVHTEPWRKVIRLVVGVAVSGAFSYGMYKLVEKSNDQMTKYTGMFLIPNFIVSFFIFGLYPPFCKWIGWVIPREKFQQQIKARRDAEAKSKLSQAEKEDNDKDDGVTMEIK
jgi:hypothetical protein